MYSARSTRWPSLSSSVWMAERTSLVSGLPRELANTWRVARRLAVSWWTSASALVLWKVSFATISSATLWLESFTRSQRREESPQLAEPVPSTPSMDQKSHFSQVWLRISWRRTCPTWCPPWTWQMSRCHFGGRLTSSTPRPQEPRLRMRSGLSASCLAVDEVPCYIMLLSIRNFAG